MSDDFLSRWSRRKRETDTPDEAVPDVEPETPAVEESDEDVLARLGLKHPDEMEPGDDFGAFLRAAVPKHLKGIAYRRLWRSNPTLACLDGLNDYDGDFTGTGVPEGGLKTSYEVGRGFLRRIAEAAEEREAVADVADADAGPDGSEEVIAAVEVAKVESESEAAQIAETVHQNDTPRSTRRRMVFRTKS